MKRLFVATAALFAAVAVTAVLVRGVLAPSSAEATPGGNGGGLSAYVVLTNKGPLTPCLAAPCPADSFTSLYVHVVNSFAPGNDLSGGRRDTATNAFVLNSIDETTLIDKVITGTETLTPPPNVSGRLGTSGRWPATVTCGNPPAPPPCTTVLNPAILPGEDTVGFFDGFVHGGPPERAGSYVFQFTLHGTLNGAPVDLTASSKSIQMN